MNTRLFLLGKKKKMEGSPTRTPGTYMQIRNRPNHIRVFSTELWNKKAKQLQHKGIHLPSQTRGRSDTLKPPVHRPVTPPLSPSYRCSGRDGVRGNNSAEPTSCLNGRAGTAEWLRLLGWEPYLGVQKQNGAAAAT